MKRKRRHRESAAPPSALPAPTRPTGTSSRTLRASPTSKASSTPANTYPQSLPDWGLTFGKNRARMHSDEWQTSLLEGSLRHLPYPMSQHTSATLRIYWQHVKQYPWLTASALGAMLLASSEGVVLPLIFKNFFDTLSRQAQTARIPQRSYSIPYSSSGHWSSSAGPCFA